MFDRLTEKVSRTVKNLRGQGKITEENIEGAIEEVRLSLLEADVQYRVVQSIIDSIRKEALGEEVLLGVSPDQQFIKILHDSLIRMLGEQEVEVPKPASKPLKILVMGLQGTGKTTTCGKLAKYFRDELGKMPLLIPADTSRPAAREQLESIGKEHGLKVFESRENDPVQVVQTALSQVKGQEIAADTVIVDTAGRLAIDENLMDELARIKETVQPDWILYALDAMAGQDAVTVAQTFHEHVPFDNVILTKMDGDARGGSALSVLYTTGASIAFLGVGEKIDEFERLYPSRLASRILGMGDVVTLVEKVQKVVDEKRAAELSRKLAKNQFTLEDFEEQLQSVQKMGSMESIVGLLPGGAQMKKMMAGGLPEKEMSKTQAIIRSMTPQERRNPKLLNGSRRKRIAEGAGVSVAEVNRMLKQFLQAKTMMSRFQKLGGKKAAASMFGKMQR
jgi:signal recognition particle subunit SRP54